MEQFDLPFLHLVMEGFGGDADLLNSMEAVYRFLNDVPDKIKMTKVTGPSLFRYVCEETGMAGISGFILIAESNLSIHTWPEKSFASLDVFCCKPFDVNYVLQLTQGIFKFKEIHYKEFPRGLPELTKYYTKFTGN